jgi:hypothetical protein
VVKNLERARLSSNNYAPHPGNSSPRHFRETYPSDMMLKLTTPIQALEAHPTTPSSRSNTTQTMLVGRLKSQYSSDDSALHPDSGRNIDYLANDWEDEHIWSCWKSSRSSRGQTPYYSRLENAVWRSWARHMNNLRKISPTTINWYQDRHSTLETQLTLSRLKEDNVCCLYGPSWSHTEQSQIQQTRHIVLGNHPQPRGRSILKKRSRSDILLQATRSSLSLSRQATTASQTPPEPHWKPRKALLNAPATTDSEIRFWRTDSRNKNCDNLSKIGKSSSRSGRKRIRFCNEVEQRISTRGKGDDNQRTNTDADETTMNYESAFRRLVRILQLDMLKKVYEHPKPKSPVGQEMIASFPSTSLKS